MAISCVWNRFLRFLTINILIRSVGNLKEDVSLYSCQRRWREQRKYLNGLSHLKIREAKNPFKKRSKLQVAPVSGDRKEEAPTQRDQPESSKRKEEERRQKQQLLFTKRNHSQIRIKRNTLSKTSLFESRSQRAAWSAKTALKNIKRMGWLGKKQRRRWKGGWIMD